MHHPIRQLLISIAFIGLSICTSLGYASSGYAASSDGLREKPILSADEQARDAAVNAVSDPNQDIGINEKLGDTIPLDLLFKDETGAPVRLRDLVSRPTIFVLVYYECPGICSPLLGSIVKLIDKLGTLGSEVGDEFNVVAISFDETNTSELAKQKKDNYLKSLTKPIPETAWRFLTGDLASIQAFTRSVGFSFKREGNDFIHTASLIMVSPSGKIVRYLYGSNYASSKPENALRFLPFDVKLALVEASENRVGRSVGRILRYCFSYDPAGRKYVLNITQIAGTVVTGLGVSYFIYLVTRRKKANT